MPELDPSHTMQVGMGFFASKALLSAVELGLFTELAKQPMTALEIARSLGLTPAPYLIFRMPLWRSNSSSAQVMDPTGSTPTRPRAPRFLTAIAPIISAASWRWLTLACTVFGQT